MPPTNPVPDPSLPSVLDAGLAKLFAESQPTLAAEQPPPPKPVKLTELHRLKLENVSLKLMNIGQQFEKLAQERSRFSREFDELRRECMVTYGVDIATTRIEEDGSFSGPLVPQMVPRISTSDMKVTA